MSIHHIRPIHLTIVAGVDNLAMSSHEADHVCTTCQRCSGKVKKMVLLTND